MEIITDFPAHLKAGGIIRETLCQIKADEKQGNMFYMNNKILKISMFIEKYSMFYRKEFYYTVNINKEHG